MATTPQKELFVSYGREPEVIQFVHRLKGDLENNGFSVWVDTDDIPAGSDWHGAIGSGLSRCKAILPIITKKYIGSRHCVNELYTANGDRKHVFPVIFEDIDFNATEAGHGVKFVISSVNWTMCRPGVDDYNNSISRLVQGMRGKGLGVGCDDQEVTHWPSHTPTSVKPLKVYPDMENPDSIASTMQQERHLQTSEVTSSSTNIRGINALVGRYENHMYDAGGKNDWHYVTLTHRRGLALEWRNRAGVTWTLTLTEDPTQLAVGKNCPYYNSGHTICTVVYTAGGDCVAALLGPWNEQYDREN